MKVTLKRATVEAFLTASKEYYSFTKNTFVKQNADKSYFFELSEQLHKFDEPRKIKAQELSKQSGETIPGFTFISLASACFDVLGQNSNETFYKMLKVLNIEVAA